MSIYDTIGVRTIINAKGTSTRVSGALLAPEVTAAMQEAAQYCVDMAEIQAAASKIIAEVTGAEAGIVTSGAAARRCGRATAARSQPPPLSRCRGRPGGLLRRQGNWRPARLRHPLWRARPHYVGGTSAT